jgi:DNA-binding response OmpR family regulator
LKKVIGILSTNSEMLEDFKNNVQDFEFVYFRSVDAIKKEDVSLLAVDCDFFDSLDTVQFLLSKIRKKIQEIPVLLINTVNKIQDLQVEWFIDDFILYPFRKGELSVRLRKLFFDRGVENDTILIGNLKIDLNEYNVYLNNERMELTYKEFELLRMLMENRGTVFSRKELLNKIWGMEYIGGTRTVDVHVRRLRGKLGDEFNSIIETVRNVGYRCKD